MELLPMETAQLAQKRASQCPSVVADLGKRPSATPSLFSVFSNAPTPYLRLVSWTCSLGGLLFGYASSSINDCIPFMKKELDLDPVGEGLVTASFMVGAALGSLIGGRAADLFGRKRALVFFDAFFIVFVLTTSAAPTFWLLVCSRTALGFSVGGITSSATVLLAEISSPEYRSQNVTLSLLLLVFGELCVFVVGAVLGNIWSEDPRVWRLINVVVVVPAIVLLFCHIRLVPESPRWLVQSGKTQLAFKTLRKMRQNSLQTRNEMREIEAVVNANATSQAAEEQRRPSFCAVLGQPWLRSILLVGIGVALTQQAFGVVVGMLFGTRVLEEAGLDTKLALIGNIAIGLISFLASWAGLFLVSRINRRPMLIVGQIGAICMLLLIVFCSFSLQKSYSRGWTTLGLLMPFLSFSQGSISTVTWLMAAEIFPLSLRGIGTGICMLSAWVGACAIGQLFPICVKNFGQAWTFAGFAFCGSLSLVFVWNFLPETRNKTLEELERQFLEGDWTALKSAGSIGGRGRKARTAKINEKKPMDTLREEEKY